MIRCVIHTMSSRSLSQVFEAAKAVHNRRLVLESIGHPDFNVSTTGYATRNQSSSSDSNVSNDGQERLDEGASVSLFAPSSLALTNALTHARAGSNIDCTRKVVSR